MHAGRENNQRKAKLSRQQWKFARAEYTIDVTIICEW